MSKPKVLRRVKSKRSSERTVSHLECAFGVLSMTQKVQNGGHLQYFENRGLAQLGETLTALEKLGALCHLHVLEAAAERRRASTKDRIHTVEEYISRALEGEYNEDDSAYGNCQPGMNEYLEAYLSEKLNEFVKLD